MHGTVGAASVSILEFSYIVSYICSYIVFVVIFTHVGGLCPGSDLLVCLSVASQWLVVGYHYYYCLFNNQ